MSAVKSDNLFKTIMTLPSLEEADINAAKLKFKEYLEKGVIIECCFEDDTWYSTDQYSNVGLYFCFNKLNYKRYYESIFDFPFQDFLNFVKLFVVSLFGSMVLKSIQAVLNDLKRIIRTNPKDIYGLNKKNKISISFRLHRLYNHATRKQQQ